MSHIVAFPLADYLPMPQMGAFAQFLLSLVAVGAVVLMVLKITLALREAFGRKPTLSKELAKIVKEHDELALVVARSVTREDLRKMEAELLAKIGLSLTIETFDAYKEERAKDFVRLEKAIERMIATVEEYSRTSYNGRKALHKEVNAHSDALNYLSGVVDRGGERVRQIIQRSRTEEGDGI